MGDGTKIIKREPECEDCKRLREKLKTFKALYEHAQREIKTLKEILVLKLKADRRDSERLDAQMAEEETREIYHK